MYREGTLCRIQRVGFATMAPTDGLLDVATTLVQRVTGQPYVEGVRDRECIR
ncbi:hypothetical protein [Mycobacterium uberis]|uniref:hypothetical protein n=1 Tax=Mycobacterium uberis TaxID=2162698 RepID=UPI0014025D0B|nr:hypothetical protein [Mycobacterium uberis]